MNAFTPATPIEIPTAVGVRVVNNLFRRRTKVEEYAKLFNRNVLGQGGRAEIVRASGRLMVYRTNNQQQSYQCNATHEEVLRAYTAFRLHCNSNLDDFFAFAQTPLTEANVAVLPTSPEGSSSAA